MEPGSPFVIPAPDQVRGFNIRDPVPHRNWIADRACPGLRSGVRNDMQVVIPDSIRDPVPHRNWIADRACPGLRSGVRNDFGDGRQRSVTCTE